MTTLCMIACLIGYNTSKHVDGRPESHRVWPVMMHLGASDFCNLLLVGLDLPVNLPQSVKRADGSNQHAPVMLPRL